MRVLLTNLGSYGDLHPYMAIGMELVRRGHRVTLAAGASYADKVRSEGLEFVSLRPDIASLDRETLASMMESRRGTERVLRFVLKSLRETYEDTLTAAKQADVVVTHAGTFGSVVAVEKIGVPWISSVLSPAGITSAYDPTVLAAAPWLAKLKILGPGVGKRLLTAGRRMLLPAAQAIWKLRQDVGLNQGPHPFFEGSHSPRLAIALFPKCLAQPQPDWPPQIVVTGFPFYDGHHERQGMPADLERFLADGPAPLVFSLGTSSVFAAGDFYTQSLEAARRLGMRAVLITKHPPQGLGADAIAVEYARFSELFPRAAAIVHPGGIGSAAETMRDGRPTLAVPFAHDQFDNGARIQRLGFAEVLYQSRYNARSAERSLRRLMGDSRYAQAAAAIATQVRAEDGAKTAADAILRAAVE